MSKKILSVLSVFLLMLLILTGCSNKGGNITIQVETEMKVGETYQIKYTLKNIDESVPLSWRVSDTGMADLNKEKLTIRALKEGTFDLIVSAKTGEYVTKTITIVKGDFPIREYSIDWNLAGGVWGETKGVGEFKEGEKVVLPIPVKEGYIFLGWYQDEEEITEITYQNYRLVAKWEEVTNVKYQINYEFNGGKAPNAPTEYDGETDIELPIPEFAGYIFKGWYKDAEFITDEVKKIPAGSTGDLTFYAKWSTIEYVIVYETNGGTLEEAINTYTVESPEIILPVPTKDGYVFKGWYTNPELTGISVIKISAGSTGDKELYAKWKEGK